jgi:hypothetical protein
MPADRNGDSMDNLVTLLKPIRRIRGNRLYAADGSRFLDLWLDGGHGILGEGAKSAVLYACNAAEKGLTRPYPGLNETRLLKALKSTWPEFEGAFLFGNEERAIAALAGVLKKTITIIDYAVSSGNDGIGLARPFLAVPDGFDLVLVRLPCPRPFAPACILARNNSLPKSFQGELLPPLMHHAATRALDTLARSNENGYSEGHWHKFGKILEKHFLRRGPYLLPRDTSIEYKKLFTSALAGGALISPNPDEPSIVPPEYSNGEAKNLVKALDALYP